jgi:hypothetical protein
MNRLAATASRTETYCGIDIGGTTNSWNYADTSRAKPAYEPTRGVVDAGTEKRRRGHGMYVALSLATRPAPTPRKGGKPHPTTRNPQRTFFTSNGTSRRRRCNASGLTTASSLKGATQ